MQNVENVTSSESTVADRQECKEQIRVLIANVYDAQKLRIATGNRLVQSFYLQLNIKPSTSPEKDAGKDERKMIDRLRSEYERISDAVAENNVTIKKQIKELNESKDESKHLELIRSEIDYRLIESYELLYESEQKAIKVLESYVKSHPLWDKFFKDIKGCGTLMAAVCIAYLDPYKARHLSSFYKYCGLDTVKDTDEEGNVLYRTNEEKPRKVRDKKIYLTAGGDTYLGKVETTTDFDAEGNQIFKGENGEILTMQFATTFVDGELKHVYEDIETGEEYIGEARLLEHGRSMRDTEMVEYIDKNGKVATRRSLTYNPIVKTKLMGVLSGCLLKAKDPTYSTMYYDYKARLDKEAWCKDFSDGRKNMMSLRYMIKQFLRNLWYEWRTLEGLEVDYPYEVAKLGNKPHKWNQHQCDMAAAAGAKLDN